MNADRLSGEDTNMRHAYGWRCGNCGAITVQVRRERYPQCQECKHSEWVELIPVYMPDAKDMARLSVLDAAPGR